jgi:hypothetical protein
MDEYALDLFSSVSSLTPGSAQLSIKGALSGLFPVKRIVAGPSSPCTTTFNDLLRFPIFV